MESSRGIGSTIHVHLLLRRLPGLATESVAKSSRWVLLKSRDEEENREIIRHLTAAGFQIWRPDTDGGPDIILEDLDNGGREEAVADGRRTGGRRVGLTRLGSGATGEGFDDLLYRPFGPRRLLSTVRGPVEMVASISFETNFIVRKSRVLLADDSVDGRMTDRFLRSFGLEVDVAVNGLEAVELTARRDYRLVLMDIDMPVMDGIEATNAIRLREKIAYQTPLPIVALTANVAQRMQQRCMEAGMDDFYTLPLSRRSMKQLVERWLDRRPTVLVVDDSPDIRLLHYRFLEMSKRYRVLTSLDAASALRLCEQYTVDVAMMDLEMPGVGGLELVKLMRDRLGARAPRTIALTGHQGTEIRNTCLSAGFSEFLTKPVTRATLNATVQALLESA